MADRDLSSDISAFRHFNRVYTRFIGTVTDSFLQTEYSLAEGRVLYEIANRTQPQAKEIGEALDLDAGYLSRILTKFEKAGLVSRKPSQRDSRASDLHLTAKGKAAFRILNTRAQNQARAILKPLEPAQRTHFIGAMQTIEGIVLGKPRSFTLRTHRPGDMGMVVALEGAGYVEQFGWDGTFEALVARIVADFIASFNPARERCWIAEIDGRHVGHIFLVQHPDQPNTAKLRLLYVDPSARGLGLGQALVAECIRLSLIHI